MKSFTAQGMEDPFEFIAVEAGIISPSQEKKLRRCRFIRQTPSSPTSSSSSSAEEGTSRFRISAHPITMRSASESSRSSPSARGEGDGHAEVNRPGGSQEKGDRCRKSDEREIRVSKRKIAAEELSGGKRFQAFSEESTQEPEVVCFSSAKVGLSGNGDERSRKLPSSFQELIPPGENLQNRNSAAEESVAKLLQSESDLIDLLLKFSRKPDKRLENVDFLEVLAKKGIQIPPPRWWRPGGYGSR